MEDEKILVCRALRGDMDSFSALVYKYQNRLLKFLLGLTFNRQDAEEILQDVFVRTYNYLHKYNSKWSFSTWIHKISVNTFKDYYKQKRKTDFIEYCEDLNIYGVDTNNSLELAYESKELYSEVVRLINNLKNEQRIAVILKCMQGFTYQEIGKVMGISTVNAKVRVNRARLAISEGLKRMRGAYL